MEIFDHQVKDSHPKAKITDIGLNSNLFGTEEGGNMLGRTVSVLHVYPMVDQGFKTDLSYDHVIIKEDGKQSQLLTDVKLNYD